METKIVDLDVLRPPRQLVKLGGFEVDVSFVPCAITFDMERIVQDMAKLSQDAVKAGDAAETKRGFDLAIDLCVLYCQNEHPEMTREWFLKSVSAAQLGAFADAIKTALVQSYEGVDSYKNPPKARAKKTR